jgi:hypothetical protein
LAEECEGEAFISELVTLGIEFPWALNAVTNQSIGYQLSLCVRCTNDYDTLTFTDWNITQNEKVIITDPYVVDIKPQFMDELPDYSLSYSSVKDDLTIELPEILDEYPETVTIEVIGLEATIDQTKLTFKNLG